MFFVNLICCHTHVQRSSDMSYLAIYPDIFHSERINVTDPCVVSDSTISNLKKLIKDMKKGQIFNSFPSL